MEFKGNTTVATLAGLVALAAGAAPAHAILVSASDPFITVRASAGSFSGEINIPLADVVILNEPDLDMWFWATTDPVQIFDGPNLVATLVNMTVLAGRNTLPGGEVRLGIDVDFGVQAGPIDTTFELLSPTMSFDPILGARATASATLGGSDQNVNGITITPVGPFAFTSSVNGSDLFRGYFDTAMSNLPSGSVGADGNMDPAGSFEDILDPVSSMNLAYTFSVSAGDTAGGTTTFSVAPAPGSIALIGLSGLLISRRRR